MSFPSINEFKSKLLDGGARPSLFQMDLQLPPTLTGLAPGLNRLAPFHCRVSEIPGTSVNPIIVKYAGREIKYAGQRVFNNLTVTILNDEGYTVRSAIELWFEAINTSESNISPLFTSTSAGYGTEAYVKQYSKNGNLIRRYRFVDIFPVNIAAIPLDWSNDAAIEEYTIEFAYQYWEPASLSV